MRRRIPTIPLRDTDSIARRYHELYGKYRIEPGTTAGTRLSAIESQFARKGADASVSLQRWTGRALNACLAALDAVKVRRLVAKAARHVFSARVQGKVWELRQLPRVNKSGWLNESMPVGGDSSRRSHGNQASIGDGSRLLQQGEPTDVGSPVALQ